MRPASIALLAAYVVAAAALPIVGAVSTTPKDRVRAHNFLAGCLPEGSHSSTRRPAQGTPSLEARRPA